MVDAWLEVNDLADFGRERGVLLLLDEVTSEGLEADILPDERDVKRELLEDLKEEEVAILVAVANHQVNRQHDHHDHYC